MTKKHEHFVFGPGEITKTYPITGPGEPLAEAIICADDLRPPTKVGQEDLDRDGYRFHYGPFQKTPDSFSSNEADIYLGRRKVGILAEIYTQPEGQKLLTAYFPHHAKPNKQMHGGRLTVAMELPTLHSKLEYWLDLGNKDLYAWLLRENGSRRPKHLDWTSREKFEKEWQEEEPYQRFRSRKLAVITPDLRERKNEANLGNFVEHRKKADQYTAPFLLNGEIVGRVVAYPADPKTGHRIHALQIGGYYQDDVWYEKTRHKVPNGLFRFWLKIQADLDDIAWFHNAGCPTGGIGVGDRWHKAK